MTTKWLFIEPCDVWMFRDNKPFTGGQNFVARSMFPPTPQTMQGALRTAVIDHSSATWDQNGLNLPDGIKALIGDEHKLGQFTLNGPYVAKLDHNKYQRLHRVPLDVLHHKTDGHLITLQPQPGAQFISNAPLGEQWQPLLLPANTEAPEAYEGASGWITDDQLELWQKGKDIGKLIPSGEIYSYESRVGLGIDYSQRGHKLSQFYQAEFVRLASDHGLLVEVSAAMFAAHGGTLPESGTINFGGEGRFAHYQTVSQVETPPIEANAGRIKIVLLTPAYFTDGAYPLNWSPWLQSGTLVSAAIGKPLYLSGWDLKNNRAKPLYHFVPAGSVYYFKDAMLNDKIAPLTETPDGRPPYHLMGYGQIAIGQW